MRLLVTHKRRVGFDDDGVSAAVGYYFTLLRPGVKLREELARIRCWKLE